MPKTPLLVLLTGLSLLVPSAADAKDPLLELLQQELSREQQTLVKQHPAPYYIGYSVTDMRGTSIGANLGALTNSKSWKNRLLAVSVRVGDYKLDNTHELRGNNAFFSHSRSTPVQIPLEDDPKAIRMALWRATDREYRQAREAFIKAKANVAVKIGEEDRSADFSREKSTAQFSEAALDDAEIEVDHAAWQERVRKYSAPFLRDPNIYRAVATFSSTVERRYLVTTEGTRVVQNLVYSHLTIGAQIKCADGMELPIHRDYFAFTPKGLPGDKQVLADVDNMVRLLQAMRQAPVVDPYTGPAILSGRAAGVFFHEVFGHRVEGHRQKSEYEGQTFKKRINKTILPRDIDVVFDPTLRKQADQDLVGYYKYDDQGIKARPVQVVAAGQLRAFLMSRSPIDGFANSNGHGRAQAGYSPVSRQSNLMVRSKKLVKPAALRKKLIAECKRQKKPFGLLVKDIQGGFTFTGRGIPNTFNVTPTEVYRVYTDGRPDQLVRGVDLVGTPLVVFSKVAATATPYQVFNGVCGAESGGVPVSAVAPSMLISQIEVQKKSKSQERPTILPRPDVDPAAAPKGGKR